MTITEDQIYGMLEGSYEQEFVDRFNRDIFNSHHLTPEQALEEITPEAIEEKTSLLIERIKEANSEVLSLRPELLEVALRDRYVGLMRTLQSVKDDPKKASEQYVKKILTYFPREILMLVYGIPSKEEDAQLRLRLMQQYEEEIYTRTFKATEVEANVEDLYYMRNLLKVNDPQLEVFESVLLEVMERIDIFHSYIYEELYYNPETLSRAITGAMEDDLNRGNIVNFPLDDYLEHNGLYLQYLSLIKPIKETKALERLWEDEVIKEIIEQDVTIQSTFNQGKYLYVNELTVLLRDGLTVLEPTGRFEHIASSRVKVSDKELLRERLIE